MTQPTKLARLLLNLSSTGQWTESGLRIYCSLSHDEIGLYIGACRETVTLLLDDFESVGLVRQHGSGFVIPNLRALEVYAGQVD
jgi:CRP-like cAMP-binding protein